MRSLSLALGGCCLSLLTACVYSPMPETGNASDVEPAPPPPTLEQTGSTCDAGQLDATGRDFDESQVEALKRASGARHVRVLRPGDAATMDYRIDRLNIRLDDNDRISALGCG